MATFLSFWRELGIQNVCITPELNRGIGVYVDKWIPILSSTDCALALALAYTWIKEDTYDKDYIATHSIGFDKWKDYVMGDEDGIPKTPAWASPLCSVPTWTIKALARVWASKTTSIYHGYGGGGIVRAPYSHESSRMLNQMVAMHGWGKPGVHQLGNAQWAPPLPAEGAPSVSKANRTQPAYDWVKTTYGRTFSEIDTDRQLINQNFYSQMVQMPLPITWYGGNDNNQPVSDLFIKRQYPLPGKPEIRMAWMRGAHACTSRPDGSHILQALQDPKWKWLLVIA